MAVPPLPATGVILLTMGLAAGCAGSGGRAGLAAAGQRPAVRGSAAPGTQPGCASWPAGSTGSVLLITTGGNGQRYCVRPGQTITVLLPGPLTLSGGPEPPRPSRNALAVLPPHVHLPTAPSVSYLAVRPGTAVLTLVGLPCHALRPAYGAAAPAGTGALSGTGAPARAGSSLTECATRLAARVTIVVT